MKRRFVTAVAVGLTVATAFAQSAAREQLARAIALWDQRQAKSAIAALEAAARNRPTPAEAAEIHEVLGRIYTFKAWQQESVFPGWHDEPGLRAKALAELKAAVAADPVARRHATPSDWPTSSRPPMRSTRRRHAPRCARST